MPKRKKEEPKNVPIKAPETESAPVKFWKNEGDETECQNDIVCSPKGNLRKKEGRC
jgi:hypothetical protein